jgi:hypothetical protein
MNQVRENIRKGREATIRKIIIRKNMRQKPGRNWKKKIRTQR